MATQTDHAPIDALLSRLAETWDAGDAAAYADLFTADASYVVFDGTVLNGRTAIEEVHRFLFAGPLAGSRMGGPGARPSVPVRFVRPDVAIAVVAGGVRPAGAEELTSDRASVVSLVLVEDGDGWRITAFQNTRVQERDR